MSIRRNRRYAGATNEQYDAWLADGFGAGNHFSAMLNGRLVGPYPMTGEMLALFRTDPTCECVAIYETGEIVWDRDMGLSSFYAKRRKAKRKRAMFGTVDDVMEHIRYKYDGCKSAVISASESYPAGSDERFMIAEIWDYVISIAEDAESLARELGYNGPSVY